MLDEGRQQQPGGDGPAEAAPGVGGQGAGGALGVQQARVQEQVQDAGQVGA